MIFFTSDTHFSHANIIKYCSRPFADTDHMNEAIIDNWNSVVGPTDVVFHLGDVALGPWSEWAGVLSRLNGYKVLVVGNHERIFKGEKPKMQEKFAGFYHDFFDEVHHNFPAFTLSDGTVVNLSHFPYEADHMEKSRHMEFRLPDDGLPLIHGHTHAEFEKMGQDAIISYSDADSVQIHVGMDAHGYNLVSEDKVLEYLRIAQEQQSSRR